jgi:hypothetical protein
MKHFVTCRVDSINDESVYDCDLFFKLEVSVTFSDHHLKTANSQLQTDAAVI